MEQMGLREPMSVVYWPCEKSEQLALDEASLHIQSK